MMNQDSNINQFYRFVMSERSISKEAAKIMVAETEKMILSTKQLFYAMQEQRKQQSRCLKSICVIFAEDMVTEYHNPRHHIVGAGKGTLIGAVIALLSAVLVWLVNII